MPQTFKRVKETWGIKVYPKSLVSYLIEVEKIKENEEKKSKHKTKLQVKMIEKLYT